RPGRTRRPGRERLRYPSQRPFERPGEAAWEPREAREGAMSGRQIMTADEIRRATIRISHEIVEKQAGTSGLGLVGVQRRGVPLARRLAESILENEGEQLPVGALDIEFYRDDARLVQPPPVKGTDRPSGG